MIAQVSGPVSNTNPDESEEVSVVLLWAKCSTCPTGRVVETMPFYGTKSLPLPPAGKELPAETKAAIRSLLQATCDSRGCAPGRCTFESVRWDPALDKRLTDIRRALVYGLCDEAEAQALVNGFAREGTIIAQLRNYMVAADLTDCLQQASKDIKGLRDKEPYSIA